MSSCLSLMLIAAASMLLLGWLFAIVSGAVVCFGIVLLLILAAVVSFKPWVSAQDKLRAEHFAFALEQVPELAHAIGIIESDLRRREAAALALFRELRRHDENYSIFVRIGDREEFDGLLKGRRQTNDWVLKRWVADIKVLRREQDALYASAQESFLAYRKMKLSSADTDAYKQYLGQAREAAARSQKVFEDLRGQLERGEVISSGE